MSSGRGFSLIEVLLAAVLGLMLLILLMRVFVPMSKGLVRGTDQSGLQQTAAVALHEISKTLTRTPPQGVTLGNGGRTLALHPLQEVNAAGRQLFADHLVVFWYDPAGRRLIERRSQPAGITNRIAFRPNDPLLGAMSTPDPGQKIVAAELETFQVQLTDLTVTVELVFSRKAPDGGVPERFSLRRTSLLRNGTS